MRHRTTDLTTYARTRVRGSTPAYGHRLKSLLISSYLPKIDAPAPRFQMLLASKRRRVPAAV